MKKVISVFLLIILLITQQALAQISPKDIKVKIKEWDKTCQACIDAGTNNFVTCEYTRHDKLDSVLNLVYKELKKEMDATAFEKLKTEQRTWLKKKNENHLEYRAQIGKSGAGPEADEALMISSDSDFIEQRIVYLLGKFR